MSVGWLVLALVLGLAIGVLTGLLPGLHVNTMALLALAASPALLDLGVPLLLLAGTIVVAGVVHTFLDYLPGALLGAPDDDVALAALPAHRLLRAGRASDGVAWSARGSQLGLLLALPMLLVVRVLLGPELDGYERLKAGLPVVLLLIVLILLSTESTRLAWPVRWRWLPRDAGGESRLAGVLAGSAVFLAAGALGMAVFELPAVSPVGIPSTLLMPALAGLFGIAGLIDAWQAGAPLPEQRRASGLPAWRPLLPSASASSVAGGVMGVLPGMTAAQATVLAQGGRGLWQRWGPARRAREQWAPTASEDDEMRPQLEIIASLSAVNTACTVMVLGFLAIVGRARSGAALALEQLLPLPRWSAALPPADVLRLLGLTVIGGLLAVPLMLTLGRALLRVHAVVPQRTLVGGVIGLVVLLSFLSTGLVGLVVLVAATCVGLIPPRVGVRRSHAMGIILLPVLLRLWQVPGL